MKTNTKNSAGLMVPLHAIQKNMNSSKHPQPLLSFC